MDCCSAGQIFLINALLESSDGTRYRFMSTTVAVSIEVSVLQEAVQRGDRLEFGVTWRLVMDQAQALGGASMIRWLSDPGCDGLVNFHLPCEENIESEAISDKLLIDPDEVIQDNDEVSVLSFHLSISGTDSVECFKLLEGGSAVSGGVVWERSKSTWHTSRSFQCFDDISGQFASSLIALQLQDIDKVAIIMPVCTQVANVSLLRDKDLLIAKVHQYCSPNGAEVRLCIVIGPKQDLHKLIRRCWSAARAQERFMDSPLLLGSNGLGFCSWEALEAGLKRPSLYSLIEVLDKLEKRAPGSIISLLIDDGWQDVAKSDSRPSKGRLSSFDLDSDLINDVSEDTEAGLVSHLAVYLAVIKRRFPGIRKIGVWLTMAGYWGGLEAEHFETEYGPLHLATLESPFWTGDDKMQTWWLPAPSRLEAFYSDYFAHLSRSGVSFVKIDDQADWEWITSLTCGGTEEGGVSFTPSSYYNQAWIAMTAMADKHFGPQSVIHCMAFGLQSLPRLAFHSSHARQVFRTSDDSFPNVPESHVWHIYHNALNACLTSGVPVVADADMITSWMCPGPQASADWSGFHAAFRACFSPCQIWLSDTLQMSSSDEEGRDRVIHFLLAPTKDRSSPTSLGRPGTVQVGTASSLPLPGCIFDNLTENQLGPVLKMSAGWNLPSTRLMVALLSVWNVRYSSDSIDWLTRGDIMQALPHQHDTIGSTRLFLFCGEPVKRVLLLTGTVQSKDCASTRCDITSEPLVPLRLGPSQWQIFTLVSAIKYVSEDLSLLVGCVGLLDKYAGVTAVTESYPGDQASVVISSHLSRAGRCAFTISGLRKGSEESYWVGRIDGAGVHTSCLTISPVGECTMVVIDMIKHLETCPRLHHATSTWQVDLLRLPP